MKREMLNSEFNDFAKLFDESVLVYYYTVSLYYYYTVYQVLLLYYYYHDVVDYSEYNVLPRRCPSTRTQCTQVYR